MENHIWTFPCFSRSRKTTKCRKGRTSPLRFIMRPSSLGGGRILRRTLSVCPSVCLSVCPSVCPSVPLSLPSVTWRHLAKYNDTHVLLGTRRGPHIVRPSRPHKLVTVWVDCSHLQKDYSKYYWAF